MKTRDTMMNDVIAKFGMEHDYTIDFCAMAENQKYTDSMVLNYYITLMSIDVFEEE